MRGRSDGTRNCLPYVFESKLQSCIESVSSMRFEFFISYLTSKATTMIMMSSYVYIIYMKKCPKKDTIIIFQQRCFFSPPLSLCITYLITFPAFLIHHERVSLYPECIQLFLQYLKTNVIS